MKRDEGRMTELPDASRRLQAAESLELEAWGSKPKADGWRVTATPRSR
jgi:hypothetical protein